MEAHVVRYGAIQAGVVPIGDLRGTVSALDGADWAWVDAADPDPEAVGEHMPELHWILGYPLALVVMAVSSLWLYLGLRKRGWL